MNKIHNPWTTISNKKIYSNQWIDLDEYDVINPGGGKGIYGKVSFKNIAIGIIPIDDDLNTWLVGQYRYTLDEYSWEIPMGGGPKENDPLISAKRELQEETGITASTWENIQKIHTSNSVTDELGYVYKATNLQFGEPDLEESESDLQIKKVPLREALRMVEASEITDSLSQAGIFKIARMLQL